jgi:hypothetical protein
MPLAEFEPEIPAGQRPQTHALDRAATGIVNDSFQFSGYLLTYRLNSRSVYYKASTKTQIKHKNNTDTQKENTKQTKQEYGGKKQYQRSIQYKPTESTFPK